MLVASLSSCHMLWYLHLCSAEGIVVQAYQDIAEGVMEEDANGGGRFVEVVLQPEVTLAAGADLARARALHEEANRKCFIANSVNFPGPARTRVHRRPDMLALTMGDPAGIGGELTLKAWAQLRAAAARPSPRSTTRRGWRALDPSVPMRPVGRAGRGAGGVRRGAAGAADAAGRARRAGPARTRRMPAPVLASIEQRRAAGAVGRGARRW